MPKKKETKRQTFEEQTPVVTLEKTTLQKAYEYSAKKGYGCVLEKGVLVFPYSDNNEAIIKDLEGKFGYEKKEEIDGEIKAVKKLPFSYGFADIGKRLVKEDVRYEEIQEEEMEER